MKPVRIGRVHGKHTTYDVMERKGGVFSSPSYFLVDNRGKHIGGFSSRAAAFKAAHEKAGPGAYSEE